MVSCVDTIILPDDKTVEEDFWQKKSQVEAMVNGAYAAMCSADVQQRMVIWACRSDELTVNTTLNNATLNQFNSGNLQTDNAYNNWKAFYSVINTCNLIIDKSASVMDIDPNYDEGSHNVNVAQMTALRSLCYFYLVRAFRDVPLVLTPFKESSQELNVPQVPAGQVMDQIISDLEDVKDKALITANVTTNWQKMGYFTRDGIYALLADCYLWRASVNHDINDYKRCVALCDAIRESRKASGSSNGHHFGFGSQQQMDDDGYNLNQYSRYYSVFANNGNDDESLFELQQSDNVALCNLYFKSSDKSSAKPWFFASPIYAKFAKGNDGYVFNQLHESDAKTDVRGYESVVGFDGGAEDEIRVRKFVATDIIGDAKSQSGVDRQYKGYDTNWIVYRVSDVMLMKAEALIQIAALESTFTTDFRSQMAAATTLSDSVKVASNYEAACSKVASSFVTGMRQVQIVNQRAQTDALSVIDSTKYAFVPTALGEAPEEADLKAYVNSVNSYVGNIANYITTLEIEVMNERARELCFEGKRWWDMMRYNYRHVEGVNYNTLIADIPVASQPKNYEPMLDLISRKYTSGGGKAVIANMKTEAYLYMPLFKSEVEVNTLLKQNPAYKDRVTVEKNY